MTVPVWWPPGVPPAIAGSIAELTAVSTSRDELHRGDGKSGSTFERVTIAGERLLLKTVGYRTDWIMRVTDDRDVRTFRIWRAGILHRAPTSIDHAVMAMARRFRFFAPDVLAPELAQVDAARVPVIAGQGWQRLAERAAECHALASAVHRRPSPLADAMATTPVTFLHGDWKLGNVGRHPEGRVVLLDWAYPGSGPRRRGRPAARRPGAGLAPAVRSRPW